MIVYLFAFGLFTCKTILHMAFYPQVLFYLALPEENFEHRGSTVRLNICKLYLFCPENVHTFPW